MSTVLRENLRLQKLNRSSRLGPCTARHGMARHSMASVIRRSAHSTPLHLPRLLHVHGPTISGGKRSRISGSACTQRRIHLPAGR